METSLGEFLNYLKHVHARTRRVATLIPPQDLEWSAGPGAMTFGDVVRHLAAMERYNFVETVQGRPCAFAGHGRELADGYDAVIAYYDRLHQESLALLAVLPEARLREKCLTPAGTPITVWKWLRAMIEHEAHHRGQLYLMLRMRGVTTPPLYGLTAEEVRARSLSGA